MNLNFPWGRIVCWFAAVVLPVSLVVAVIFMVYPRVGGRVEWEMGIRVRLPPVLLNDEVSGADAIVCWSSPEDFDPELVDKEVAWERDWVGLFKDFPTVDEVTGIASLEGKSLAPEFGTICGMDWIGRSPREAAIDSGLAWLAKNQSIDGSWGKDDIRTTGLVLLAFMRQDIYVRRGITAAPLASGINWLRRVQDLKTGAYGTSLQARFLERHAIANSAMALARLSSGSILLRKNAMKSTAYLRELLLVELEANSLMDSQATNPSVAMWVFHSLKASHMCGLDSGLSAEAIAEGLSFDQPEAVDLSSSPLDLQALFFATMALKKVGGVQWEDWKQRVEKKLLGLQSLADDHRGSWHGVGVWGADGDRAYSTALCLLILGLM
ncbi:MAG: hypothetical protein H8E15_13890 [Planctomycetes bacterium]|nr:hypothetical protein [Planctomycetota bacterium]